MAVLMIMEATGLGADDYDRVDEIIGDLTPENAPPGLISHAAAVTEDGLVVVDVWESAEALQAAFESQLGPAFAQAGIPPQEPRVLPLHNHIHGSGENDAVLVLVEFDGMSTDDYDALTSTMDAHGSDGSNHPAVAHMVASDGDTLVVADIWGSVEEFAQFGQEELAPRVGAERMETVQPRFASVHKYVPVKAPVA